jgi:Tfp pilus assembly protein PilF
MAQQIQGQVRYSEQGQPAIGVLVRCDGTGGISTQMTDRNGKFYFRVSPGHYTVSVNIPGFLSEQRSTDLLDTRSVEYMDIRLRADRSGKSGPPAVIAAPDSDPNVPAKAREEFEKGRAAIGEAKKEKVQEGIAHLEKAVTIYSNYQQAQLMLGTTYMDLQQWDKAEQHLRKTLEINPKTANALFALGEMSLRQKKDDEAEKELLQGLQIENRSFQGHLALGRVYWDMALKIKDESQAKPFMEKSYEHVKQALALNPEMADAHLLKGNLLLRVRRAEDAMHEFQEYLRLDPKGQFAEQTRSLVEKIKKALAEQPKQ